jgi:hypothetical protein
MEDLNSLTSGLLQGHMNLHACLDNRDIRSSSNPDAIGLLEEIGTEHAVYIQSHYVAICT